MVRVDDQLRRLQGEKRSFDILAAATERILRAFAYDEKGETSTEGHASVKNKKRERTSTTMSSSSGKRLKKIDECENQDPKQNPNRDACSPSLCHVESKRPRQVVSEKTVGRGKAPVRRIKVVQVRGRTPDWLVNVMRENNGTDVKMIKEKVLEKSDLDVRKARLLIPWNGIVDMDFLNEDELEQIDKHFKKTSKKGVDFIMVGFEGQQWKLNLRRWDMSSSSNYALASGWNKVAAGNRLEINQRIRIWSFRSLGKLYIALVPPDPSPAPAPDPAPSSPPALGVTRDSDELNLSQTILEAQEERERRVFDVPRRRLTSRVPIPAPFPDWEAQEERERRRVFDVPRRRLTSRVPVPAPVPDWEGLNLLVEVCETTRLEALQEANRRSSLVSATELDLELRLYTGGSVRNSSAM